MSCAISGGQASCGRIVDNQEIFQENTRVASLGKTVSVVYALPLPRQPNDLSRELREELQGAYLLQRRANDAQSDLAGQPLVRGNK